MLTKQHLPQKSYRLTTLVKLTTSLSITFLHQIFNKDEAKIKVRTNALGGCWVSSNSEIDEILHFDRCQNVFHTDNV